MKVKLLVGRCGPEICQSPGEVVPVSEAEGARMIAAGQAVLVSEPEAPAAKETAVKKNRHEKR